MFSFRALSLTPLVAQVQRPTNACPTLPPFSVLLIPYLARTHISHNTQRLCCATSQFCREECSPVSTQEVQSKRYTRPPTATGPLQRSLPPALSLSTRTYRLRAALASRTRIISTEPDKGGSPVHVAFAKFFSIPFAAAVDFAAWLLFRPPISLTALRDSPHFEYTDSLISLGCLALWLELQGIELRVGSGYKTFEMSWADSERRIREGIGTSRSW